VITLLLPYSLLASLLGVFGIPSYRDCIGHGFSFGKRMPVFGFLGVLARMGLSGGYSMSYDHRLLFGEICLCLQRNPCCTLAALSTQLHVSSRTIQKAIFIYSGKSLRELREEILIARLRPLLLSKPTSAIKEPSFDLATNLPVRSLAPFAAPAAFLQSNSAVASRKKPCESRATYDAVSVTKGGS
jgi:hypothetical protein